MAFVLSARGPEGVDINGVPNGFTPVIVTIDGSRRYHIAHSIPVATADADVPAALEAVAPPASEQRTRWSDKANNGLQAEAVVPEDWVPLVPTASLNLLRFIENTDTDSAVIGVGWSDFPITLAINGAPLGRTITYDGETADEESNMTNLINTGNDTQVQLWIRNTTRSENGYIDPDSFVIGSNTFDMHTDIDISAWVDNDALTTQMNFGAVTNKAVMYLRIQTLIEGLGLERAILAQVMWDVQDKGTIGTFNTAPWARPINIERNGNVGTAYPQVSGRYVNTLANIPIWNGVAAEMGTIAFQLDTTGSQTMIFNLWILGLWA